MQENIASSQAGMAQGDEPRFKSLHGSFRLLCSTASPKFRAYCWFILFAFCGMTLEFQKQVLQYLLQTRDGQGFIARVDEALMDDPACKAVLRLSQEYMAQFKRVPNLPTALEYARQQSGKIKLSREHFDLLVSAVHQAYQPLGPEAELNFTRQEVIEYAQLKGARQLFQRYALELDGKRQYGAIRKEVLQNMRSDIQKLLEFGKTTHEPKAPRMLFRDFQKFKPSNLQGHPFRFAGMNRILAAGGIKPGEVHIFMSGPKAGKTTLMVSLGAGFAADGLPVFYADTENGVDRIERMFYQSMTGCTYDEILAELAGEAGEFNEAEPFTVKLERQASKYRTMGGEVVVQWFPPKRATADDVEVALDHLQETTGFMPELIIADYLDNYAPIDKSVKDKRLQIQEVYFDFKRLAESRRTTVFSPSQVNRQAIDREKLKITDLAEDIGKAANADSIWGFVRTENERIAGEGRIMPLGMRNGKDYGVVYLSLDIDKVQIKERDFAQEQRDLDTDGKAKRA